MHSKKTDLFILVFLFLLVISSAVVLSKPIFGQGLTHEDYNQIFRVRLLKDSMIRDPIKTWLEIGPHEASTDFYLLLLYKIFQNDYSSYLKFSIFLKIIATLSLYFVIKILFKNRLLAFLTSLLFGISHTSFGALTNYTYGNEYLSISFISLITIVYFYSLKKNKYWLIILLFILNSFLYVNSPGRTFPIIIIILIVELLTRILIKPPIFFQLIRLFSFISPLIILILITSKHIEADPEKLSTLPIFLKIISEGNWYLLLNPLFGLGHMFLTSKYFLVFGQINFSSVWSYFESIIPTTLIFGSIALFLSLTLSQKPIRFFYRMIIINLLFETIGFLLLTHHFYIPSNLVLKYSSDVLFLGAYAQLVAFFLISLSINCLIEWYLQERKNKLLLLPFISLFISFIFICGIWLVVQSHLMYQAGIHRYLLIPQITASLFLASLMTNSYENSRKIFKPLFAAIITTMIIFIFIMSRDEISDNFNFKKNAGANLQMQTDIQTQVFNNISTEKIKNNMLFYIKLSVGPNYSTPYEEAFNWRNFTYWMYLKKELLINNIDGCIAITWEYPELINMIQFRDKIMGFSYMLGGNKEATCYHKGVGFSPEKKFFSIDDFHAFTFEENKLVNITNIIKQQLTQELYSKLILNPTPTQ